MDCVLECSFPPGFFFFLIVSVSLLCLFCYFFQECPDGADMLSSSTEELK